MMADSVNILKNMQFSVCCFADLFEKGSAEREQARLMGNAIREELEFCIRQIEAERNRGGALRQDGDTGT